MLGVVRPEAARDLYPPTSAKRRGGAPAFVRARLARRLSKSGVVEEPLALLQVLWPRESRALVEFSGDNAKLDNLIKQLIDKHGAHRTKSGWELDMRSRPPGGSTTDPWLQADPWSMAKSAPAVTQHAIEDHGAGNQGRDYENYTLRTKFVDSKGKDINFAQRQELTSTRNAVTLCHSQHLDPLLAALDPKVTALILVNALSKSRCEQLGAKKTQIIVTVKNTDRVLSVYAVVLGDEVVSAVQQAWKLDVVDADSIAGTLRLRRDAVTQQVYDTIAKKEGLSIIVGSLAKDITFLSRKFESDPEATRWSWEAKRANLRAILQCSGTCEANIQIDRAEEDKLAVIPVFASASSAEAVRDKLGLVPHLGVVGPTRSGCYIVRSTAEHISQVRRLVLTSTSTFQDMWDLVVTLKFVGRFPKKYHMTSIAASMRTSMKWKCIPIQQRPAGKGYHHVTLGSDTQPPSLHVAMGEEIIILRPEINADGEALTSTFEVLAREEPAGAMARERPVSLASGVEQLCTTQLRTAEARIGASHAGAAE